MPRAGETGTSGWPGASLVVGLIGPAMMAPPRCVGLADHAATVEGADVGAALLEYPDNRTRVILRASSTAAVEVIAEALGGGGHAFAAAAVIDGSAADALALAICHAHASGGEATIPNV